MQRGSEFSIMLGQVELMNSRTTASEEALAALACKRIAPMNGLRYWLAGSAWDSRSARDLLRARDAGGLREAGFVIGGLGIGGLLYAAVLPVILRFAKRTVMMATGGAIAGVGLAGGGLDITWTTHMAFMVVLGFGFFLLHNSVQTEVTELAPSARASSFSLHAFSFFLGQALGPMVYGVVLPTIGATISLSLGATLLAATGVVASLALRPLPCCRRAADS
jgi:hypothetical protein